MRRIVILFPLVFLPACVNNYAKNHSRVKVETEIDLSEKEQEAFQAQVCIEGKWPSEKWWDIFDDPQLSSFIEAALNDNPSLSAAETKVRQANQEAYVVRAKLFPQVNAPLLGIFSYLSKNLADNFNPAAKLPQKFSLYSLALEFDYEFDFWKKNRNLFEAAVGEMRVQKALAYQTKLIISTSIAHQYFDLMGNMAKIQIMEEILERRSHRLQLVNLRKIHRLSNLIDINKMKEEIVTIQKFLAAIKEELELEMSMIKTLMGKNPAEKIQFLSLWKTEKKPCVLPNCVGLELIARRPDLMAQIWRVERAARLVDVAIADFYPNIDLSAFGGLLSLQLSQLFTSDALSGTLLPFVHVPIFQGGRIRANFKAKMEAYQAAVEDYNNSLLDAANDVVQALARLSGTEEQLKEQIQNVALTKQNYNLIYSRYTHGVDSMVAVLQSDEDYLWARIGQIELETTQYHSIIDLMKALGGGYQEK